MISANISVEETYRLTRKVKGGLDMTGSLDAPYRDWRLGCEPDQVVILGEWRPLGVALAAALKCAICNMSGG